MRVAEGLGPVDVLVNAAVPGVTKSIAPSDREFIVQATNLGLIGPIQLATRLRFRLAQSRIVGGGSLVNTPATRQWFELTHPDTAQAELARVTQQLGTSWVRHGVRVNSIAAPIVVPAQARGLSVQIESHSGPLLTRVNGPTVSYPTRCHRPGVVPGQSRCRGVDRANADRQLARRDRFGRPTARTISVAADP